MMMMMMMMMMIIIIVLSSFVFTRYSNNIYLINNIGKMITLRKKKYKKTVPLVNTVQLRNITHKKGGFMHNEMTDRGKLAVTINPGTIEVMHTSTVTSIGWSFQGYHSILLSTNISVTFTFTSLLCQPFQVLSFVILCAYA